MVLFFGWFCWNSSQTATFDVFGGGSGSFQEETHWFLALHPFEPSFDHPSYFIFTSYSYSLSLSALNLPLYCVYAWTSVYVYPYICVFNCKLCLCVFQSSEVWVIVCMDGRCVLLWISVEKKNGVVCEWAKIWFYSLYACMEL